MGDLTGTPARKGGRSVLTLLGLGAWRYSPFLDGRMRGRLGGLLARMWRMDREGERLLV